MSKLKKILLTRPPRSSERWAVLLAMRGIACVVEPLLTIELTHAPRPEGAFQAVILTSPNALEDTSLPLANLHDLPCFCVGAATGETARACGFTDVHCGNADSAALALLIADTLTDKRLPLLHIAGETVDGKAEHILTKHGFNITRWRTYAARAAQDFTTATRDSFVAGDFAALPVFSPRSARTLVSLIEKNHLTPACRTITAIALSQAVANVLDSLPWRCLRVATTPAEEDILACLLQEFPMIEAENTPPPLSCKHVKPRRLLWSMLGIVLITSTTATAYQLCPWFHPVYPVTQNLAQDVASLAQQVKKLEERVNAPPPMPAPPISADMLNAAVAEQIKGMQTQAQGTGNHDLVILRQHIAAAVAFLELHETTNAGTAFSIQLEALRAAAAGDEALLPLIEQLAPYASSPTPTLPQLHAELITLEPTLSVPTASEEQTSFWSRLITIFHPLVSVRPLHDPQLTALENTLDTGDIQTVLDLYKALSAETQKGLASWHNRVTTRAALDKALHELSAVFTSPPQPPTQIGEPQGKAP